MRKDIDVWNLKDIIRDINSKIDLIESIYLFGSRGYGTGSLRSDIDLLLYSKKPLHLAKFTEWLITELKPVDLFETNDLTIGRSLLNGSSVFSDHAGTLPNALDAVLLWDINKGFSESFVNWEQITLKDLEFPPTILPIPPNFEGIIRKFTSALEEHGYPNTFLGSDWLEIIENLLQIINRSVYTPEYFNARAKFISKSNFKLDDEYDFQNLVHIVLKPWLPSIESENLVIKYNGQEKNADFSILQNKIVIEAKHIKSNSDRAGILKTLEGLKEFYKHNANVKGLLFILLVNKDVDLDDFKIRSDFSNLTSSPVVLVGVVRNRLG